MKKFVWTFSILLIVLSSKGQITFQKTYGGTGFVYGWRVMQTADGGYILSGYTDLPLSNNYTNIILIKTDSSGDTLWTKTFDGGTLDFGYSLIQTNNGGYLICGATYFSNNRDALLIQTDAYGNVLWNKTYNYDSDAATSATATADGGFIIGSSIIDYSAQGVPYAQLIKTDSTGNLLWSQIYYSSAQGGNVYPTPDGGYIFCTTDINAQNDFDVQFIKTDTAGNPVWRKVYRGQNNEAGDAWQTTYGGYIICGNTTSFGAGNSDVLLIKTDSTGDMMWAKTYGGASYDYGSKAQQTFDGGYIITGSTYSFGAGLSDVYLIKTDSNGDTIWTRTFGGANEDAGYSVQQTADSGYIISGYTLSFGDSALYLIKTDANGNSGCNQASAPMIVSAAPLQQLNSSTVSFSGTSVDSASLIVNSGGPVTTLCPIVGISESETNNILNIFPNPATENLVITYSHLFNNGAIEFYNVFGEKIFSEKIFNESNKEINLGNILNGIYFIKVFDGEKNYCKKLIVEHD